jgi:hypothetical protein
MSAAAAFIMLIYSAVVSMQLALQHRMFEVPCLPLLQVSPNLHEAIAESVLALQDSEADQGRFTRVYYRLMQAAIKQAATHGQTPYSST